jgi:hypothetical protein
MSRSPRKLLLNDEGSSALHYLDLDAPGSSWSSPGAGRDLQLIGAGRVLRSTPGGFVELSLAGGKLVRNVTVDSISAVESAQRLANGHTVLLGSQPDGIALCEVDGDARPVPGRRLFGPGLGKGRMVRQTLEGTLLFCSETDGKHLVHEATWHGGIQTLFEVPAGVPADSMVKVLRVGPSRLVVSSGYAASLLLIDTSRGEVVGTIGGKQQVQPPNMRRPLAPHFFSGYQLLAGGDYLVANWQGHGPSHAGDGYQVLRYAASGALLWCFDQTEHPRMTSLNNVIALDGLDTSLLHDEQRGHLAPVV